MRDWAKAIGGRTGFGKRSEITPQQLTTRTSAHPTPTHTQPVTLPCESSPLVLIVSFDPPTDSTTQPVQVGDLLLVIIELLSRWPPQLGAPRPSSATMSKRSKSALSLTHRPSATRGHADLGWLKTYHSFVRVRSSRPLCWPDRGRQGAVSDRGTRAQLADRLDGSL